MATTPEDLARARSLLAVPGHRPDRFDKAARSGADSIMLDLEDSVGPDLKPAARDNVDQWLASGGMGVVRINAADTAWHNEDLAMLAHHRCIVMIPKVVAAHDVAHVLSRLAAGSQAIPVFETAAGVLHAEDVCAMPGVVRAIFGNADLGAELGVDPADRRAFGYARSRVVLASSAARLPPPIDGVTVGLQDTQALREDARHAKGLGFTGKACLHPRQVPTVNEVFTPTEGDLAWAREVLSSSPDGSVGQLHGQVVGKPMLQRARRLLASQN